MCPYCYIGKRRMEKALEGFVDRDKVELVWRSYQLQPDTPEDYAKSTYEMVAARYNISLEEAKEIPGKTARRPKALIGYVSQQHSGAFLKLR